MGTLSPLLIFIVMWWFLSVSCFCCLRIWLYVADSMLLSYFFITCFFFSSGFILPILSCFFLFLFSVCRTPYRILIDLFYYFVITATTIRNVMLKSIARSLKKYCLYHLSFILLFIHWIILCFIDLFSEWDTPFWFNWL
jgi:hypothetical protein